MFNIITSPTNFSNDCLFLAGGITDCPDWQSEAIDFIRKRISSINIFNPRRENFDTNNVNDSVEQITWEYNMFIRSQYVIFWFPKETLCPITLFELGKTLSRLQYQDFQKEKNPLYHVWVGCHEEYKRKMDLTVQLDLLPSRTQERMSAIYSDLTGLLESVTDYFKV